MWKNYFYQIQNKYSMRVSLKQILVIRLDGKSVTRDRKNDFINDTGKSFLSNMKETVRYFTNKYNCYAIFGSDEVSFLFTEPSKLINDLDNTKYNRTNEIISLFSQYFFSYFDSINEKEKIFWHAKCFSIKNEKLFSYIKYRSNIIKNVLITHFLIKKNAYRKAEKLVVLEEKCKEFSDYEVLKNVEDGIMYYNGERIDLNSFYNNEIKYVLNEEKNYDDIFEELNNLLV